MSDVWGIRELAELMSVLVAVNGGTLWAVKKMIENQREQFALQIRELVDRDSGQDANVDRVQERVSQLEVHLARDYIHRDDAIIFFGRFEQKMDAVWDQLIKLQQTRGMNDGS